ncbi:MAG: hypothetical protein L6R41_004532 [Letrouitia leprolyta]|nr:MAG: hypothetical protein L6R41_004532 [Letrouitia leprolyta]
MPMSSMVSAFYTSTSTTLFFSSWTPESTGAYAGTCIFLILLAAIFRGLAAGKHALEHRWLDEELNRRYVAVRGKPTEAERINSDSGSKNATLITERGVEEHVKVVRKARRTITPWRLSVDVPRAAYATLMAGVGYLLMLAVMTLNVGYFLSILGGTFLGELALGRYTQLEEHGH